MRLAMYGAAILVALLSGCTKEDDISAFIRNPGVTPKKIAKLPTTKTFPGVVYDRMLVKDPFVAHLNVAPAAASAPPVKQEDRQPLEMFGLDTLSMVGMMHINGANYALIRDPERQVHRVGLNQRIGQNYGKVIQISKNGVQLKESVQDNAGLWIEIDTALSYQEGDNVIPANASKRN